MLFADEQQRTDSGDAQPSVHTQLASVQRKVGANRQTEIVPVLLRGPLGVMRRESRGQ
jgi:hypothetical protein